MTKAENRALEAYPQATRDIGGMVIDIGHPQYMRDLYIEGYHQAEKDLELTWKDMVGIVKIANLLETEWLNSTPWDGIRDCGFYAEVLKRFKEIKKE